jgi:hypothetical protein
MCQEEGRFTTDVRGLPRTQQGDQKKPLSLTFDLWHHRPLGRAKIFTKIDLRGTLQPRANQRRR